MIKKVLAKTAKLRDPRNFFDGLKAGSAIGLPENILIFKRTDVLPTPKSPNQHHRFLLSLNLGKPCELVLDGVRFPMGSQEAILVYPHQHHLFIHDHPGIVRLMVSFETESRSEILPPKDKVLHVKDKELSIASELLDAYLTEKDGLASSLLLSLLLNRFKKQPQKKVSTSRSGFVDSIIGHIQRHLSEPLSVSKLGRRFNMSASNLRLRFRKLIGISLGRYIIESRLNRAQGYLGECDMKVAEIAEKCGYRTVFSFSHAFKKHVGTSPLQYRQSFKNFRS